MTKINKRMKQQTQIQKNKEEMDLKLLKKLEVKVTDKEEKKVEEFYKKLAYRVKNPFRGI